MFIFPCLIAINQKCEKGLTVLTQTEFKTYGSNSNRSYNVSFRHSPRADPKSASLRHKLALDVSQCHYALTSSSRPPTEATGGGVGCWLDDCQVSTAELINQNMDT